MSDECLLEIRHSDGRVESVRLANGRYAVGRGGVDVSVDDVDVSRRHASVTVRDGSVTFTDKGSLNGSFDARGRRIEGSYRMALGEPVRLGKSTIRLTRRLEPSKPDAHSEGQKQPILDRPNPSPPAPVPRPAPKVDPQPTSEHLQARSERHDPVSTVTSVFVRPRICIACGRSSGGRFCTTCGASLAVPPKDAARVVEVSLRQIGFRPLGDTAKHSEWPRPVREAATSIADVAEVTMFREDTVAGNRNMSGVAVIHARRLDPQICARLNALHDYFRFSGKALKMSSISSVNVTLCVLADRVEDFALIAQLRPAGRSWLRPTRAAITVLPCNLAAPYIPNCLLDPVRAAIADALRQVAPPEKKRDKSFFDQVRVALGILLSPFTELAVGVVRLPHPSHTIELIRSGRLHTRETVQYALAAVTLASVIDWIAATLGLKPDQGSGPIEDIRAVLLLLAIGGIVALMVHIPLRRIGQKALYRHNFFASVYVVASFLPLYVAASAMPFEHVIRTVFASHAAFACSLYSQLYGTRYGVTCLVYFTLFFLSGLPLVLLLGLAGAD